jgi:hypothetical protein
MSADSELRKRVNIAMTMNEKTLCTIGKRFISPPTRPSKSFAKDHVSGWGGLL